MYNYTINFKDKVEKSYPCSDNEFRGNFLLLTLANVGTNSGGEIPRRTIVIPLKDIESFDVQHVEIQGSQRNGIGATPGRIFVGNYPSIA